MFIKIINEEDNKEYHINVTTLTVYNTKDEDGKYKIVYKLVNGIVFIEAFDTDADRQEKLDELEALGN